MICMHIGYMRMVVPGLNTGRFIIGVLPGGMPGDMTPVGFWLVIDSSAVDVNGCCGGCDMFIASFISINSSLRRWIASKESLEVFFWAAAP